MPPVIEKPVPKSEMSGNYAIPPTASSPEFVPHGAAGGSNSLGEAGESESRSAVHELLSDATKTRPFLPIKTTTGQTLTPTGDIVTYSSISNPNLFYPFVASNIIIDSNLITAQDGIYTWIIKDVTNKGRHLFAARPRSGQEIGTLHINLHSMSGSGTLVSAGELAKIGSAVQFNLLSGTFMAPIFKTVKNSEMKELRDTLITQTTEFMTSIGINALFNGDEDNSVGTPILGVTPIVTTNENLARYNLMLIRKPVGQVGGRRHSRYRFSRRRRRTHRRSRSKRAQ